MHLFLKHLGGVGDEWNFRIIMTEYWKTMCLNYTAASTVQLRLQRYSLHLNGYSTHCSHFYDIYYIQKPSVYSAVTSAH